MPPLTGISLFPNKITIKPRMIKKTPKATANTFWTFIVFIVHVPLDLGDLEEHLRSNIPILGYLWECLKRIRFKDSDADYIKGSDGIIGIGGSALQPYHCIGDRRGQYQLATVLIAKPSSQSWQGSPETPCLQQAAPHWIPFDRAEPACGNRKAAAVSTHPTRKAPQHLDPRRPEVL